MTICVEWYQIMKDGKYSGRNVAINYNLNDAAKRQMARERLFADYPKEEGYELKYMHVNRFNAVEIVI